MDDEAVDQILERTRQRRLFIMDEDGSADSPQLKRKPTNSPPLSPTSAESPAKRPSFDEKDKEKEKRRSLYPMEELNEIRRTTEEVKENEVPLKPREETGLQDLDPCALATPTARKARLAALAASVNDFEFDMRHCPVAQDKNQSPAKTTRSAIKQKDEAKRPVALESDANLGGSKGPPAEEEGRLEKCVSDDGSVSSAKSSEDISDKEPENGIEAFYRRKQKNAFGAPETASPSEIRKDCIESVLECAKQATEGFSDDGPPLETKETETSNEESKQVLDPGKVSSKANEWEAKIKKEAALSGAKLTPRPPLVPFPTYARPVAGVPHNTQKSPSAAKSKESPQRQPASESTAERKERMLKLMQRWEALSSGTAQAELEPVDDLELAASRMAASMDSYAARKKEKHITFPQKTATVVESPKVHRAEDEAENSVEKDPLSSEGSSSIRAGPKPGISSEGTAEESATSSESKTDDTPPDSETSLSTVLDSDLDTCLEMAFKEDKEQFEALEPAATTPTAPAASLIHTVSFYRILQKQHRVTPMKGAMTVVVKPPRTKTAEELKGPRKSPSIDFEQLIKSLNGDVTVQQEQIVQASRALNFCRVTDEFRGSREEVDAQRALLIATEKRRCLLTELDRVNVCRKKDGILDSDGPLGTLAIHHITVQLKREFVNDNFNRDGDLLYYFICLLKHCDKMKATQMVTSDDGLKQGNLEFSNYIQLPGLPHDFKVKLEIFALRTTREAIPHEEKYRLTLKSKSKSTSMFSQGVSSLGGPGTILDPSFQLVGSMNLTLDSVNRHKFLMEGVPFSSPIHGALFLKLRCFPEDVGCVEERGFLSAYEEISGFGSWTRLWCVLKDGRMKFWRYPDEEGAKECLNMVDLGSCITDRVGPIDREVCARPNTFYIDVVCEVDGKKKKAETYRIMLSADGREECRHWCQQLNATLRDLRVWNPAAQQYDAAKD